MICRPRVILMTLMTFRRMEPLDESRSSGAAANARLTRVFGSGSDDDGESCQW